MRKLVVLTLVAVLIGAVPAHGTAAAGGTISGTVTADGLPRANVRVTALSDQWYPSSTLTAADGTYVLGVYDAGWYAVKFEDIGRGYSGEYYANARTEAAVQEVRVRPGAPLVGIDAALDRLSRIDGTVTNHDAPVAGVTVQANSEFGASETTTASDGTYVLSGLDATDYTVCFSGAGVMSECFDDQPFWEGNPVTVPPGEAIVIDAAVTRWGRIEGTLATHDDSWPGLEAWLYRVGEFESYHRILPMSHPGWYAPHVAPGNYVLRVVGHAFGFGDEWYPNAASRSEAAVITVVEGGTTTGIDIVLDPTGSVSGRVTWPTGEPATNTYVYAVEPGGDRGFAPRAVTDPDGHYEIDGLRVGSDYALWFDPMLTAANLAPEWNGDAPTEDQAEPIIVSEGQTLTVDAQLGWGGVIMGRVRLPGGAPAVGIDVLPFGNAPRPSGFVNYPVKKASTDANGVYVIRGLATGDYKIRFSDSLAPSAVVRWYKHKLDEASANPVHVEALTVVSRIDERFPR